MPELRARGAQTRRSHASASSSPPPNACPPIAATTGTGTASSAASAASNGCVSRSAASSASRSGDEVGDVVAGREDVALAGEDHAAGVERRAAPSASPSSSSRSSALRLAGLAIVTRATPVGGRVDARPRPTESTTSTSPSVHRLALLDEDLGDGAVVLGLDGHLHLHRLQDHDRVALCDLVPDGDLDLPHGARDVGLDLRHASPPDRVSRHDIDTRSTAAPSIAYTRVDWCASALPGTMDIAVRRDLSSRGARRTGDRKRRAGTPGRPRPPQPAVNLAPMSAARARRAQGAGLQGPAPEGALRPLPRAHAHAPARTSSTRSCGS